MSGYNYDWIKNYWPEAGLVEIAQNILSQDVSNQSQTQDALGQSDQGQQQQQQQWQDGAWDNPLPNVDPLFPGQRQPVTAGQDQGQAGDFYPYLDNPYGPNYPGAQETFRQRPQSTSPAHLRQQQQQQWQDDAWVSSLPNVDPLFPGQQQSVTAGQDQDQAGNFYPYLNNSYGPNYPRAQEAFMQRPQSASPAYLRQQQEERRIHPFFPPASQSPRAANQSNSIASGPQLPPKPSQRPRVATNQANPPAHTPSNPLWRSTQYPSHPQMATTQEDPPLQTANPSSHSLQSPVQQPSCPQEITNQPKPPMQDVPASSTPQQPRRSPRPAHMSQLEYDTQASAAPWQHSSRPQVTTDQPWSPQQLPHPSRSPDPLSLSAPPKPQPAKFDIVRGTKRRRLEDGQNSQLFKQTAHPTKSASFAAQNLSNFSYKPRGATNKNFLRDRCDLVQPLKDIDAAEKTSYDPKTIAKDILIAAGRHPTEPPLNHHLMRLRDVFTQVDTSSDLDTFQWDVVDAPGMQVRPVRLVKTAIPSGLTPTDPDGHRFGLQLAPADQTSQLQHPTNQDTPAADQTRDSFQPVTSTPARTPPSRPAFPVRVSQSPGSPQQQQQQLCPPQSSQRTQQPQFRLESPTVTPKRRASQRAIEVQLPQTPHSSRLQKTDKISSSRKQSPASSRKSLQPKPQQPQPRPRGRIPKKDEQRKQQSAKMVGKRSASRIQVSIPVSTPVSYPVYACKWQNCPSELHNLDLLRHHLLKSHIPYTITCGWSECMCPDKMSAAELFDHVKEKHLDPVAWELGDGPSVSRAVDNNQGSKSPRAQATPESNQQEGEDSLVFPASYSSMRAFNRVHGNNSQQDKAREIFKAVQRLKERIGVGLDPGGCQLATPERNERVSDEEEVYELHSESETGSAGTPKSDLKF